MLQRTLPSVDEMVNAFVRRDSGYDGIFFTGVKTTGIFCRPTCSAKKPLRRNLEFFPSAQEALLSGYRPCLRCHPMEPVGSAPEWIRGLLAEIEEAPLERWKDDDLRRRGLNPDRVRRWFLRQHGMTFHAYQRARRMGLALKEIHRGEDITQTAFESGFESLSGFRDAFKQIFGAPPGRGRELKTLSVARLSTPLGPMLAAADDQALYLLEFCDRRMLETQIRRLSKRLSCRFVPGSTPVLDRLQVELSEYFDGQRKAFEVPLEVPGTPFQVDVWRQLQRIPFGQTRSYQEQAQAVGRPQAVRAVGTANGDNRIAIIIPCHRVIASNGSLCGYGGGLWRKRYLLELEGVEMSS